MVLPYNLRNLVKVFDMGARVLQVPFWLLNVISFIFQGGA